MIGRLRGVLLEKQPPWVLLEIQGVSYEIQLPLSCFFTLPDLGQEAIIFTQFVVREDTQLLYGFSNSQERALFRELLKVNSVGPKMALGILSGMSARQFISAIAREDITSLTKLPSVGKKTAERLVIEMKDRLKRLYSNAFETVDSQIITPSTVEVSALDTGSEGEAVSALIALGYKPQEASRLVSKFAKPGIDLDTLIREALRAAL